MMRTAMASELNVLTRALNRLSEADRRSRDFTLNSLRRALVEVIACFPGVSHLRQRRGRDSTRTSRWSTPRSPKRAGAIRCRSRRSSSSSARRCCRRAADAGAASRSRRDRTVAFAHKFQQYTAPVVAKGLEDTAFYSDVLLLSANEVGGDLRHRTRTVAEFHPENLHRLSRWPLEMTAGSTHDTKRGEDARARINVISELPDEWRTHLSRWAAINDAARRARSHDGSHPIATTSGCSIRRWSGAWPAEQHWTHRCPPRRPASFVDRMRRYMRKAIKEAKRHTSWLHENPEYEEGVSALRRILAGGRPPEAFLASFVPFQRRARVVRHAQLAGAAGAAPRRRPACPTSIRAPSSGISRWSIPTIGSRWTFSCGNELLGELRTALPAEMLGTWPDGRVKMFTLSRALCFRRDASRSVSCTATTNRSPATSTIRT